MRIPRSTPRRGLVAGLAALIAFASAAVALTAGGSRGATTQAQTAQAIVAPDRHARAGNGLDGDDRRRDERSADVRGHHR
jgi:hypothetical protein